MGQSNDSIERWTTTSDGVNLRWFDYGPAEGRPVVLCHGLAAGAAQFDIDARAFAANGFRVIVPDLRGHGNSDKASAKDGYSIARMALDLIELLEAAGASRVDFVGNSLGGILAFHLVKQYSGQFRTLTTFGTSPALTLPRGTGSLIPLGYRLMGKRLTAQLTAKVTTPNPQARALVAGLVENFDPEVGKAVSDAVARYDLRANAQGFAGPLLVLRCEKDFAVNAVLDRYLADLGARPNVEVVRIEAAGHCANLDQPEVFRRTLQAFWARH